MKKKMNNKGFSLVELIVVIAIMGVIVGVLAPQFIQYIAKSRRSTDVKNGQEIAAAMQAAIADEHLKGTGALQIVENSSGGGGTGIGDVLATNKLLKEVPPVKSEANGKFLASYDASTGEVKVYLSKDGTLTAGTNNHVLLFPKNEYN